MEHRKLGGGGEMSDSVRTLPTCQGKTAAGTPCERIVSSSATYCYAHDPTRATERSTNASRAAKSKASTELREIKSQLKGLADDVVSGKITSGKASVASQVFGVLLKAFEAERKFVAIEDLKAEVAEVREMYEQHGYGADGF
jgi:hypothetical protein